MKKLTFLIGSLLLLAACGDDTSGGTGEEVYEIKLGHTGEPDHHYNIIAEEYAELVNERSDGKIDVSVYPADQLGNQLDSVEAVMSGSQDMVLTSETVLSNWQEDMGILNLPYMFKDLDHVQEVLEGEVGDRLGAKVEDDGAVLIAWWAGGLRHITNSVRPIETPEDLKNIKIRTPEGEVFVDTFEELGASPTVISLDELYSALQLGTIDAQENPPAHILTKKFYEVQDYISKTNHIYLGSPLIMNKDMFDDMPEEYRDILIDTGEEMFAKHIDLVKEEEDGEWEELKETGVEIIEPDPEPFEEAVEPVIEKYKDILDKEIIEMIQDSQ